MSGVTHQPPPAPPPPGGYPPNPYGGTPYTGYVPDHPEAVTVLVLGILGLVVCGLCAPIAWVKGNRVVAEIDASHGQLGGRGTANAGRICGMVGTIVMVVGLAFGLVVLVIAIAGVGFTSSSG
jgi:uncharacterized membrane protein YjgN (DUF898 family)